MTILDNILIDGEWLGMKSELAGLTLTQEAS
jgi:hypothetical protein